MNKRIYGMEFFWAIIILAGMVLPASTVFAEDNGHKLITRELINLVEKNPEIRDMLEASIAEARKINPDPKTNPVQNLLDYYDFIDTASDLIPQDILDNPSNLIRDQILQSLCYFAFQIGRAH